MLRPVPLERGLNVEADIAGGRGALAVAGANGAKHSAGGASDVAHGGAVLDEILRELDAVVDQVAVATDAQFNVAIEFIRIIGEREGKFSGLIGQRQSSRKAVNDRGGLGFRHRACLLSSATSLSMWPILAGWANSSLRCILDLMMRSPARTDYTHRFLLPHRDLHKLHKLAAFYFRHVVARNPFHRDESHRNKNTLQSLGAMFAKLRFVEYRARHD